MLDRKSKHNETFKHVRMFASWTLSEYSYRLTQCGNALIYHSKFCTLLQNTIPNIKACRYLTLHNLLSIHLR